MMILVTGKNNSGKSMFAERIAASLGPCRYYIATMRPFGIEGLARVEKHQMQRAELDFTTLELPVLVGETELPRDAVVLLEDVSNLLANSMFERKSTASKVFADINRLADRVSHLVIVTISRFNEGNYDQETQSYMQELAWLNRKLEEQAEVVAKLHNGRAVFKKGELHGNI